MNITNYDNLKLNKEPFSLTTIHDNDTIIDIALTAFPFDRHQRWIKAFAHIFALKIGEIETLADMSLTSINYDEAVFILHVSELTENIWISNTHSSNNNKIELNQLLKHLSTVNI